MELMELLGGVEVLRGLEKPQLKAIIPCCQRKTYQQGSFLFRENEEADHLWAVISGEVDLRYTLPGRDTAREMTISRINTGRVFGWSSLVPPHRYRLSAFCVTNDCEVLQMGRSCLAKLFSEDTEVGYRVMSNISQVIGARFQALQDEIVLREGSDLLFKSDW